jgi:ACS family tartrate transporter-like MFS transporter
MPTAFLSGAAAAAGVAYINSIANISGFVGNYVMGWLRDMTGNFDSGLLVIAAVCNVAAFTTLCIHHDKESELNPVTDDMLSGDVANIV